MIRITGFVAFIYMCVAVFGQNSSQTANPKLEFEVASVKILPPADGPTMIGMKGGPGTPQPEQITISGMPMKMILARAFDVKVNQVTGPAWLDKSDAERYEITAKVPAGASKEDANIMLQNLLVERFGLGFHREQKEMAGYELVVGKNGPKLKEAEPASDSAPTPPSNGPMQLKTDANGIPQLPAGRPGMVMMLAQGRNVLAARQQTVKQLAGMLENRLGKPVVDKTGLNGLYDFAFAFDPTGLSTPLPVGGPPPPPAPGTPGVAPAFDASESAPSLVTAIQQELGLKLDQKKVTVDLVVVDKLEKIPTDN